MTAPPSRDGPRVNDEIRAPQVRLIDQDGEMQGVMTARDAWLRAQAVGLDLLEISPNADPPVVKILDFGKYKYELQKKKNEAKKKQKVIEIKEIKVRPNIDENDYQVKMRAMKSFIEEGDKVKVTLRFRGREMAHQEIGVRVLERIKNEMDPVMQGGADAADGEPSDGDGADAEVAVGGISWRGVNFARSVMWGRCSQPGSPRLMSLARSPPVFVGEGRAAVLRLAQLACPSPRRPERPLPPLPDHTPLAPMQAPHRVSRRACLVCLRGVKGPDPRAYDADSVFLHVEHGSLWTRSPRRYRIFSWPLLPLRFGHY